MKRAVFAGLFCPSVYPSVIVVNCDKTTETCAHIFIPHERLFILVLSQEE